MGITCKKTSTVKLAADPPGLRWTKRVALGLVVVVLVQVGAICFADIRLGKVIDRRLAELRERGEPTSLGELSGALGSDGGSAGGLYEEAALELVESVTSFNSDGSSKAVNPADIASPADRVSILELNAESLRLLREAGGEPTYSTGRFPLDRQQLRQFYWLLTAAISHSADEGYVDDALAYLEDYKRLLEHSTAAANTHIDYLSHLAGVSLFVNALETAAPKLLWPPDAQMEDATVDATAQDIERLARWLLDDAPLSDDALRCALQGERTLAIAAVVDPGRLPWPYSASAPSSNPLFHPLQNAQLILALDSFEDCIARNCALASNRIPRESSQSLPPIMGIVPTSLLKDFSPLGWYKDPSTYVVSTAMGRRLAATHLAIALRARKTGELPISLDVLAPAYLPHVPRDLYAGENGALIYRLEHDPPLVYSVNENGVDDGGAACFLDNPKCSWSDRLGSHDRDLVVSLEDIQAALERSRR